MKAMKVVNILKRYAIKNMFYLTIFIVFCVDSLITCFGNNLNSDYVNNNEFNRLLNSTVNTNTTIDKSLYQICGVKYCLINQSSCISSTRSICHCDDFYETYPNDEENIYQCNYTRKKQIIAFCLELVLMCGSGHLYIGNFYMAVPKFLLFMLGIILVLSLRYYNKDKEEDNPTSMKIALAGCVVFCLMLAWELFDIIMFAFNKYKDSNGVTLYPFKVSVN